MKEIFWSKHALRSIRKLPVEIQGSIVQAVENLPNGDTKFLSGKLKGLIRLRVGDYRVIFEKIAQRFIIYDVVHRKNAYKNK